MRTEECNVSRKMSRRTLRPGTVNQALFGCLDVLICPDDFRCNDIAEFEWSESACNADKEDGLGFETLDQSFSWDLCFRIARIADACNYDFERILIRPTKCCEPISIAVYDVVRGMIGIDTESTKHRRMFYGW